jgi:ABC-type transport system involved in multi-copper enzyme maturation permease subunit
MVANTELLRVGLSGWCAGLSNLLRKENRTWWASRRWLVQSVVWTAVVNGFVALVLFTLPAGARMAGGVEPTQPEVLATGVQMLFQFGTFALALGAIILVQDAIIGERQLGVTEWLLSKPVSRAAYVLSKLLAHGFAVLVILVGLQGALGYGLLSLVTGEQLALPAYLVGVAGLAVHTLFYLALTLMMGVLTANRRTVLAVSLGTLFGGLFLLMNFGRFLGTFTSLTPWWLNNLLPAVVLGMPLPLPIWLSIGTTAGLSIVFVAVTLARFQRLEF